MVTLDLRHVASPAVRDLLHLVNHPDFDRAQQQIERLGGCTEPVRLTGQSTTVDTTTGEVLRSYTSSAEPAGSLLTACGNRRAFRCPACSRLYAADTYHLIRASLSGGKTVPDTVRTHPRVFTTPTGNPLDPTNLTRRFRRPLQRAGLRRIRFHDLRHSTATLLLEQGVDLVVIEELLGHAHIGVTAGVYPHVRLRLQRHAIDTLSSALDQHDDGPDVPPVAAVVH